MGPGALHDVLSGLRLPASPNLLIGLDVSDDAAVYRISPDTALVQTVDFFPPIVDDPYTYGAIAAANSLSDVYAMGGRPMMALAVAAFPDNLPLDIVRAIMQGGADKVAEAGAVLAGGHTVVDREPKYGLAVTGTVHPEQILAKARAQPGDLLLLTKPLGTGLISTALKRDAADAEHVQAAIRSMLRLNKLAAELTRDIEVHSATDITGYGLLGHAAEIARNSGVGMRIDWHALPMLPGALSYAAEGAVPGGLLRNQQYLEADGYTRYRGELSEAQRLLLFDPQTSGGLLLAMPPAAAEAYSAACAAAGQLCFRIGEVIAGAGIDILGE
jgi:selenide,water dikinase